MVYVINALFKVHVYKVNSFFMQFLKILSVNLGNFKIFYDRSYVNVSINFNNFILVELSQLET